jgi:hypothetical protein
MGSETSGQESSRRGGARPGAGQPPLAPTDEERVMVEKLSGLGLQQESIAAMIRDGIDTNTLRLHFKRELELGKAKANGKIAKTLFDKAVAGDTGSLIWWTKTQMRWAETQKHEIVHTGISITGALESAKNRLLSADIIDVEGRRVEEDALRLESEKPAQGGQESGGGESRGEAV